jgi:hypothetical protein
VSLVQPPVRVVQLAPEAVQFEVQRESVPLLLPCQKRRLVPVPTGSMRAVKPSPPLPICHCTGPGVELAVKVTEKEPLSWAPPFACWLAALAKLPLMSPE